MHYTYAHLTPAGQVFYIGKGVKDRVFAKSDRSLKWRAVVAKFRGYTAQILADWKTEAEAYRHEQFLIQCFKDLGHELVNQTSGGKGALDYCQTQELRAHRSKQMKGLTHTKITCPHCGFVGGATSTKRWHFDNCSGRRPQFKSRPTVNGVRVYLGKFHTKEEADKVAEEYKAKVVI